MSNLLAMKDCLGEVREYLVKIGEFWNYWEPGKSYLRGLGRRERLDRILRGEEVEDGIPYRTIHRFDGPEADLMIFELGSLPRKAQSPLL